MNNATPVTPVQLRGALPPEGLGARGIEHAARNPDCLRLQALTLASVSPATAARTVYGEPLEEGQSPLALAAGQRFERFLFADNAAELCALYLHAGRWLPGDAHVCDLTEVVPGKSTAALAERCRVTLELLRRRLEGDSTVPRVLLKPRLQLRLFGTSHDIEPDALVASVDSPFYRVVEAKAYPDREGKTSSTDLRGACRQAAVGLVALRQALATLGHPCPPDLVPAWSDLVLVVPGPLAARLRPMPVPGEVDSIERLISRAPAVVADVAKYVSTERSLDDPHVLDAVPNCYRGACREYCALAPRCKRAATLTADPVLLGDSARAHLLPVGSLTRTLRLLRGDEAPSTPDETALTGRLQQALAVLKKVANDV